MLIELTENQIELMCNNIDEIAGEYWDSDLEEMPEISSLNPSIQENLTLLKSVYNQYPKLVISALSINSKKGLLDYVKNMSEIVSQ